MYEYANLLIIKRETSNELFLDAQTSKENDTAPKDSKQSTVTINEDDPSEEEEDVDDLEVAWETLEVALSIITKHI